MDESASKSESPAPDCPLSQQYPVDTASYARIGNRTAPVGAAIVATVSAAIYLYEDFGSSWGLYLVLALAVGGIVWLFGPSPPAPWESTSSHPDPDVKALIEGRINISDYRRRKEATAQVRPNQGNRGDA